MIGLGLTFIWLRLGLGGPEPTLPPTADDVLITADTVTFTADETL